MDSFPRPRSPLWMVVLAFACEEPMHPYRMQTLIKQRGKDKVANVAQRNSVYQTIEALRRAGLITVRETMREARRPERTVYQATPEGRRALVSWIRHGISTPAREFPEFPAALSLVFGSATPDELAALLEARAESLRARRAELETPFPNIPRVFLLEDEYSAALVKAELTWLSAIIRDLRSGRLAFPTEEEIRRISPQEGAPSEKAIRRAKRSRRGHSTSP
jgi:DNA-binding PadR family transcriptional regulator